MFRNLKALFRKGHKLFGTVTFRFIKSRQIAYADPRHGAGDHLTVGSKLFQSILNIFRLQIQQSGCGNDQLVLGKKSVTCGQIVAQFKENARFHSAGIISADPQRNGKAIDGTKESIHFFLCQKIRVVVQKIHSGLTVFLIGTHGKLCRQLMKRKEFHQLPHSYLQAEGFTDL